MNTAAIAAMIVEDPTIPNDIPGFVARMNTPSISVQLTAPVIVQEATTGLVSIAERNGGPCTEADVQAAIQQLGVQPFIDAAVSKFQAVASALATGDKTAIQSSFIDVETAIATTRTALGIS